MVPECTATSLLHYCVSMPHADFCFCQLNIDVYSPMQQSAWNSGNVVDVHRTFCQSHMQIQRYTCFKLFVGLVIAEHVYLPLRYLSVLLVS